MRRVMLLMAGICLAGTVSTAQADSHAEGAVKYRKAVMKSIGGHAGAIGAVAKGQVAYGDHVVHHAIALGEMGKIAKDLFPEGTGPDANGETEATNDIWAKPDEFKMAVEAFAAQSAKLAQVAQGGDMEATMAEFGNLGKTCGGCHKPFRKKR